MITFDKKGGGERLVINLARELKADVFTGFIQREKTFDTSGINVVDLGVNKKLPQGIRNISIAKKFAACKFPKYDCYFFSGVWCISASQNLHPNVFYCHTPPRYMYDLQKYFMAETSGIKRIMLKKLIDYWKPKDKKYMQFFDVICPNSENVRRRIRRYYGESAYRKSHVVYTGIETKKFYSKKSEGFYLAAQRLDKLKRLDLIINAFKKMPDKKLVITGTGSEEAYLKQLARGCSNIEFAGNVSEEKLLDLYARCTAAVSAPVDEDLGLTSIESQAAGKPVVAVREGGLLETVIENKTGIFFEPNVNSLISAIGKIENKKWNKSAIQKNAARFDIKAFEKTIKNMIKLSVQTCGHR
jgi:glycosyltransferase involved in cell wall biosynthesis